MIPEMLTVNEKEYRIRKLLGSSENGVSYLAEDGIKQYVLKQIHQTDSEAGTGSSRLSAELGAYGRLCQLGIRIPELLDIDLVQGRILKEFVDGPTVFECIRDDLMKQEYLDQMTELCQRLYANQTNIDYFPENFVIQDGMLFYVAYACSPYTEAWNFANTGSRYWSKTPEFMEYMKKHA